MYPKRLIKNPSNPTARDRRDAFEYHLALCCLDDEPQAQVVNLNGSIVTTADGVSQFIVTNHETLRAGADLTENEPTFVFGTDQNGDGVYWYTLPA